VKNISTKKKEEESVSLLRRCHFNLHSVANKETTAKTSLTNKVIGFF